MNLLIVLAPGGEIVDILSQENPQSINFVYQDDEEFEQLQTDYPYQILD